VLDGWTQISQHFCGNMWSPSWDVVGLSKRSS
jgi:hypothetical protein